MNYRPFGRTGVRISEVSLGTWQLGGTEWGDVSDAEALAILHAAADAGVNLLDTADIYGGGRSEGLIRRFLGETKKEIHVATKLCKRSDGGYGGPKNFSLPVIRQHVQDSLKRLGLETIFLEQFHCPPLEELQRGELFDHIRTVQKEGLIQHWGVSVESIEEGLICLKEPDCASLQVIYNIFRQRLKAELLPKAKERGVAILARLPLASGVLSGTFGKGKQFAANDHRRYNANGEKFNVGETFAGIEYERAVNFADRVKAILKPTEAATMAELTLRWILDDDCISTVIPGATKLSQVVSNVRASDLPHLSAIAHAALEELYRREVDAAVRGKY